MRRKYPSKMNQVIFFALVATSVFCFAAAVPQNPYLPTPTCEEGETAYNCGRSCELKCNEKPRESCKYIVCEGFNCGCRNGFARNPETDRCVPVKECPVKKCPKGEVKDICGKICERTCASQKTPEICSLVDCNPKAKEQCRCHYEAGYLRNETTDTCVLAKDC